MLKLTLDQKSTSESTQTHLEELISDFANFDLLISFPAYFEQSKIIRDNINFLFEKNGIRIPWKSRFSLITDEMVNNSIEHGSLEGDENHIHIRFATKRGKLSVKLEVKDTGRRGKVGNSEEMEKMQKEREDRGFEDYRGKRGRGLFQLIKSLVDDLYFEDNPNGGLTVGVSKVIDLKTLNGLQK